MDEATRGTFKTYLWLSQILPLVSLVICSLIIPNIIAREGGISNFGNHKSTAVFYSLGFLATIVFLWLAAQLVTEPGTRPKFVARSLKILSIFVLIVYVSTFLRQISFTYSLIHDYVGAALYAYQFVIAVWIVAKRHTAASVSLLAVQTIGSLIALLSVLKVIQLLFIGQVVGTIGFGLVLCLNLPYVDLE